MKLWFDGGCKPNPGQMEICVVAETQNGIETYAKKLTRGTNNIAEWSALLHALEIAKDNGAKDIVVHGDSLLVVSQATGAWKCKNKELQTFLKEYHDRAKWFNSVRLVHVPREENPAGHYLENAA